MGASFSATIEGGARVQGSLAGLVAAFGDLSPLMADLGLTLESATIDRFDSETSPSGAPWKPSARARIEGGKTLSDSAQLRGSIHSIPGSDRVEVGTNKIYAGVHQFGATIRAKNAPFLTFGLPGGLGLRRVKEVTIPARPFLGLSADDEAEVLAQAEDYAAAAMGGAA